jgi:hypothetical protein
VTGVGWEEKDEEWRVEKEGKRVASVGCRVEEKEKGLRVTGAGWERRKKGYE